ncbi:MAG: trigger factor [Chloroflexota bacterium]
MNIQTERLDNHTARFTVEIEPKQWDDAKKAAAREISKQINVKGFRKGKAPYSVVVRRVGEGVIIEEAMEQLGNDVYREVINNAEVEPYAAGNLEDFKLEPQPTYVFTVPMQPEIELGDYREVRVDYEAPVVEDEEVDKAMRQYQQREAVVEDSVNPVQSGDRVTIDIHAQFADGEDAPEDPSDFDEEVAPYKGDTFVDQVGATLNLDPENEPLVPGFIDALVGAKAEETVEFELDVPDDNEDFRETVRGRKVNFAVTVNEIQNVTLPELNDDLAARITEDEDEPLTLLELRMRTREELETEATNRANQAYSDEVLDAILEGATLHYPEVMVVERINDLIDNFEQELRQQGMDLETYQKVMGVTHDDLHDQYEEQAVGSLERSLVLGEVLVAEGIQVTREDVSGKVDEMLAQFGEQADMFRQFFDTEQQRTQIANSILFERVSDRLVAIGKGEAPDLDAEDDIVDDADEDTDEPVASVADDATDETEDVVEEASSEDEADADDTEDEDGDDDGAVEESVDAEADDTTKTDD